MHINSGRKQLKYSKDLASITSTDIKSTKGLDSPLSTKVTVTDLVLNDGAEGQPLLGSSTQRASL